MDEAFDTTLSAVITSDGIKGMLNSLIWQPGAGIVALTVVFMLLLLLVAAIIRACAVFELQKACYELRYEMNNRPDWIAIPLAGIARIL